MYCDECHCLLLSYLYVCCICTLILIQLVFTCVPISATASSHTPVKKHIAPPTTNPIFSNASFHTPII